MGSDDIVPEEGEGIPVTASLDQNHPNPFNPSTTISYYLAAPGFVSLKVYDLLGREVAVLVGETKDPGAYKATFDATGFATGIYLYRLQAGAFSQTRKMLLLR